MKSVIAASFLALACSACASTPPVWKASSVDADQPIPTLMAGTGYEVFVKTTTMDVTGLDFGATLEALGNYAAENPDEVVKIADDIGERYEQGNALAAAIVAKGPAMQRRLEDLLENQGFAIEFDAERSAKLIGGGMVANDVIWSAPNTAPRPFGLAAPDDRDYDVDASAEFPMFGSGSKKNIAGRLASGRDREAYASVETVFHAKGGKTTKGLDCSIVLMVLDASGDLLFQGRTTGSAPAGDDVVSQVSTAFDAAFAKLSQPEVVES